MLLKDKKYAVAVSDMQGWRISEFLERRVDGVRLQGSCRDVSSGEEGPTCGVHGIGKREEKAGDPEAFHDATDILR